MATSGQLYQFVIDKQLEKGNYIRINGPYDTFGVIQSVSPGDEPGTWHHLVRGQPKMDNIQPVFTF